MYSQTKKITILCSRLDLPGGTERAICNFANLFAAKGHSVNLLILDEAGSTVSFYELHKNITITHAPLHFGITTRGNTITRKLSFIRHILQLRKLIVQAKPDITISTDYPFSIAGIIGKIQKITRFVSWEPHHFYWLKKNRFWSYFFNRTYKKLYAVICLNETEKKLFENIGCHAIVIPGFVPQFSGEKATLANKELLTVGWFIRRKGIDLIPSIAKLVFKKHSSWKWVLVGKGEELQVLKETIQHLGLENNFSIIPPVTHVELEKIYHQASIYVMTSRSEGFPAVLIESMAHGVPCVSFDCPTGPSDIIRDNEDGKLVALEDIEAMAEAICLLIENPDQLSAMGEKSFHNIRRFSPENTYSLWEANLFKA